MGGQYRSNTYETWQEAGKAARNIGIKSPKEYYKKYRLDPRLPSNPYTFDNFPGFKKFLDKEFYKTCELSSMAAIRLKIRSGVEYFEKYKLDPRLPSAPSQHYEDFPGWQKFLELYYDTVEEAAVATRKLNIKSSPEYSKRYKLDIKLPSDPKYHYKDFPGWLKFLDIEFYTTWEEASRVAIELGFKTCKEYSDNYFLDKKLPSNPNQYYIDFPTWPKFLGCEFYETWQEAGRAAKKIGITNQASYRELYSLDNKLPRNPDIYYKGKGYPGLRVFLDEQVVKKVREKKKKNKLILEVSSNSFPKKSFDEKPNFLEPKTSVKNQCYSTWKESIWACLKIGGIYDLFSYRNLKHKDPKLRDSPQLYYLDFRWGQKMFFLSPEEKDYFREKEKQGNIKKVV